MGLSFEQLPTDVLDRARELRQNQTSAEHYLWQFLRDRRLNGVKFRRQHPFPPYTVDFYTRAPQLVIELDGQQHGERGRSIYDLQRERDLNASGIRVIRFSNDEVLHHIEAVLQTVWRFTQSR